MCGFGEEQVHKGVLNDCRALLADCNSNAWIVLRIGVSWRVAEGFT